MLDELFEIVGEIVGETAEAVGDDMIEEGASIVGEIVAEVAEILD